MRSLLLTVISAFALWVVPASSFAACGVPDLAKAKMSFSAAAQSPDSAQTFGYDLEHSTIVGLWDIKFYSGGQLVDEGFDAWHSDGLEELNDTPPPSTGNVCFGVFAQIGERTFKLKHPSWTFDSTNTNLTGTAIIRETVTVDRSGNTFSGTFTLDYFDTFGNKTAHFDGSVKATRIKVD